MKKISIFLALVALVMTLFAINVFAASFTRGPEGDTIAADDLACEIELVSGTTAGGQPSYVLDGSYASKAYWSGGANGSAVKVTFANEWEITDAKAMIINNYTGIRISFYAADDTLLGEANTINSGNNSGFIYSGDSSSGTYESFNSALSKIKYGDDDKAVKYIIVTKIQDKWGWLPGVAEVVLTGRERIPSVGCEKHEFAPYYPVEPGCETTGTVVNKCVNCGAEEAPATAPALGHKMGEYTIKTPATCDTAAVIEYECERCGLIVVNQTHIKDVTDYVDFTLAGSNGAGGYTTSHYALFDNNMDSYLHASGGWFVESWIELDQAYYITSVTVWTDSWSDNNSWEAFFTFYYQAPGSDEWVTVSPTKSAGVGKAGEKNSHTLELATPVYADAIKIKVDRLCSFQGQAFEAEVAGTLFADPQLFPKGHTWEETGDVPSACYAGYTLSTCTTCGATKQDEFTKAVGHVWADATCLAPKTCTVCAATEGDVGAHLYDNANDATCNREGCDYVRGVARIGDKYFATLADAFNEAVEGNEIVVLDKIVVEGEATWNLTGKTITFVNSPADNYAVVVKGDLTIVGGTYNVTGYFGFGVTGKLTVKGGTFVAETADYLIGSWGTTTINGGSFKANYNCVNAFAGSVVINGGNFEVIDVDNAEWPAQDVFGEDVGTAVIYGGTFSTDIYAYLAETYHIDLDENGKYVAAPTIHVDAKAATCTTNGNVEYWYCETCELVWVDKALTRISNFKSVVTPAAHAESVIQIVTKPTCTDPGEQENICSVCGEVVSTETIAPVAHTVAHVDAEEATCETEGNIEYWYCTVCGAAWTDEACTKVTNLKSVITPAAHTVEYVAAKEATCFEQGNVQYWYCTSCNIVWADEAQMQVTNFKNVIIPITHNVEHVAAKAATCTENGNIEYWYCLDCGYAWLNEACTLNTNLKAVVLPAGHVWSETPEETTPATCVSKGAGMYYCTNCWTYDEDRGEVEMPIDPTAHADMTFNDAYTFATCPDCNAYAFYGTHKGIGENDLIWMFMGNQVNIYKNDLSFDVYYNTVLAYSEETGYTVTLVAMEDGDTTYDCSVATIKFNEDGTLLITLGDLVFGKDPSADVIDNAALNGTYAFYDMGGNVNFMVKFENGIVYVIEDNMMLGLPETFNYEYNVTQGTINTGDYGYFYVSNDELYFGRGWLLTPVEDVEEPEEPDEPEVNYGDKIGSITVETTDTYGFFDLYSYTSTAAGKYSFFVPAGLGFYSKALFDTFADAEVGFYDNEAGDYVSFDLAAGETIEFYVGSLVKDTWTIDVYYYTDAPSHVHTEVAIDAILPTPSTTGYTAGIECSECGEYIVEPQEINVTTTPGYKIFGINSTNLILGNNISLDYKVNVSEGYGTPYMVFVFEGVEYIVTEYEIDGGKPVFNFAETRPHKIATNVEAYVYAETADGYTVDKYDYSVMKYCISKLKKNESVEVISDLLVFGAETQKYVASMTNTTVADEDLITSIVEAQGYTLKPSTFTSIPEALKAQYVDVDANDDLTWKSSTVVLGSSTEMVYKFAANDITGLYIKIEVDGVQKMMIDAADLEYDAAAKRYVVSVNCVSAVQYGSEVKATFVKNGVESDSVAYSINGFLYNNLAKNEGTVLGNLMKALYLYGNTTYNYFYNN